MSSGHNPRLVYPTALLKNKMATERKKDKFIYLYKCEGKPPVIPQAARRRAALKAPLHPTTNGVMVMTDGDPIVSCGLTYGVLLTSPCTHAPN